jgi:hypothetical protein
MKSDEELVKKLGFVSCAYLLDKTGISNTILHKLKSYGIVKPYKTSNGVMRGYYTYKSFKILKEFMDEYKGYFGHPASLKACLMAFKKNEANNESVS